MGRNELSSMVIIIKLTLVTKLQSHDQYYYVQKYEIMRNTFLSEAQWKKYSIRSVSVLNFLYRNTFYLKFDIQIPFWKLLYFY